MKRINRKSLILHVITLLALVAVPLSAWAADGLQICACLSTGDSVAVKVANTTDRTLSGVLSVTVVVDGTAITSTDYLTVPAGGAAYAVVSFNGKVDGVLTTRIVDDNSPI